MARKTGKISDILITAREYVKRGWCQNRVAVDKDRMPVLAQNPKAVAWCAFGSVLAACGIFVTKNVLSPEDVAKYLNKATPKKQSYIVYSDTKGRKKNEVLALFEKAIALAQEEGN